MKRCAIYTRVSLEEQVERYGLASQLRGLREYCANRGYAVVAEASDEGQERGDSGPSWPRAGSLDGACAIG